MANFWLIKSDPDDYSFDNLLKDTTTSWDGVSNNQAQIYLRSMKKGDQVLVYHTGKEKAIVGIGEVVGDPRPDPKQNNPRFQMVELRGKRKLGHAVFLSAIKSDRRFVDFALVKNSRLSVMPVSPSQWEAILDLGK